MENVINVSDVKSLIAKAHATLCVVLHALETKVLVGEINRPGIPAEKKPRKKRTRKVKMNLEKEYQADRIGPPLQKPLNLPDADKDNPFYAKPKKERKKREKKIDGGE